VGGWVGGHSGCGPRCRRRCVGRAQVVRCAQPLGTETGGREWGGGVWGVPPWGVSAVHNSYCSAFAPAPAAAADSAAPAPAPALAPALTGSDAVVPVKLGPFWGRRSRLLDPDSGLQRVVLSVQAHLTAMGMAVDGSRPPHIEVIKH
jgi:hypothetical protein